MTVKYKDFSAWQKDPSREFKKYQGFGEHAEMLKPKYMKCNIELIHHILETITQITAVHEAASAIEP